MRGQSTARIQPILVPRVEAEGDPKDETEDASTDHDAIRDAVGKHEPGKRQPDGESSESAGPGIGHPHAVPLTLRSGTQS